jgi:hypothetical protein
MRSRLPPFLPPNGGRRGVEQAISKGHGVHYLIEQRRKIPVGKFLLVVKSDHSKLGFVVIPKIDFEGLLTVRPGRDLMADKMPPHTMFIKSLRPVVKPFSTAHNFIPANVTIVLISRRCGDFTVYFAPVKQLKSCLFSFK